MLTSLISTELSKISKSRAVGFSQGWSQRTFQSCWNRWGCGFSSWMVHLRMKWFFLNWIWHVCSVAESAPLIFPQSLPLAAAFARIAAASPLHQIEPCLSPQIRSIKSSMHTSKYNDNNNIWLVFYAEKPLNGNAN